MWECPALFELTDGDTGMSRWVFWSAGGLYMLGGFDGFRFTPETPVLSAYDTPLPYAAQLFAGVPGRTVAVAWLRTGCDRGNFRGMMSVPAELSLGLRGGEPRIRFRPAREITDRFGGPAACEGGPDGFRILPDGRPVLLSITASAPGTREIRVGETDIAVPCGSEPLLLLADNGAVEYYGEGGFAYGAAEVSPDALSREIVLRDPDCAVLLRRFR